MIRLRKQLSKAKKPAKAKAGSSSLRGVSKTPKKRWIRKTPIWQSCMWPCPSCKTELPAFCSGKEKTREYQVKVHTDDGDVLVYSSLELRLPCPLCLSNLQAVEWQGTSIKKEDLHHSLNYRPRQHLERVHNKKGKEGRGGRKEAEWKGMRRYALYLLCGALHEARGSGRVEVEV